MRRYALPLALMLVAPVSLVGQQAPTVAVLPFHAASITAEDVSAVGSALTDMITTELSSRPKVRTVERSQLESILQRQQAGLSGRLSDQQVIEIGNLLGANYMVLGSIVMQNDMARIDIRMLDVETGQSIHGKKVTGKRADFLSLVEQVADEFTKDLKVPQKVIAADTRVPAPAALAYSRGLDYEKRGKAAEARGMFSKALELYPQHPDAKAALERVKTKGGRS
jgi:TolB-like protein